MNKGLKVALAFLFLFVLSGPSPLLAGSKTTMALLDFDAKNVSQESADAVTDLLRTELFNTGRFTVVEREKIRRVVEEQNFQMSGLTDSDQAVEIGRLLNVQAIMLGSVTRLGSTHIINTRLVNIRMGVVVLAESIECRGGEGNLPASITELAATIANKIGLEGAVIHIEKRNVLVDLGQTDGVKVGDLLSIIRPGEIITDLEGTVIGSRDEVIGTVEIVKVEEAYSEAKIKDEAVTFQRGDRVKPIGEMKLVQKEKKKKDQDKKPTVPIIF